MPDARPVDPLAAATIRAWNLMAGAIDWAALPVVAQLVGVDDLELLAAGLVLIRTKQSDDGNPSTH